MAIDTIRIKDLEEVSVNDLDRMWIVVDSAAPDSTNKVKLSAMAAYVGGVSDGKYIPLAGSSEITGSLIPKTNKEHALGSDSFKWLALYAGEIHAADVLSIPQASPAEPEIGKLYLYAGNTGSYSQVPSGGGTVEIYDLYIKRGNTQVGPYDLSEQDQTVDISTLFTGYATETWVSNNFNNYTLPTASSSVLGGIKIGTGLLIDNNGVVSVTGQTQGTVTRVDVGISQYNPDSSGVISLPAYPSTPSSVGLGNVTNDAQVKRTEMGAASGVATLGTDGKIPSSQLPSYVDDVLEYASTSAFPSTGESGKIYVALDTNKTYRWSGTGYVEISPSIVIGTTTGTAFDGKSGYDHVTDGDIHVTAALKTVWSAKYDKPSGGIPATDLADTYLPLSAGSGKALTGDLYFDSSSAAKYIKYKKSSTTMNAITMAKNGDIVIGSEDLQNTTNGTISFCSNQMGFLWGPTNDAEYLYFSGSYITTNASLGSPNDRIYRAYLEKLDAATSIETAGTLSVGGVSTFTGKLLPSATNATDIGSSSKYFKDGYLYGWLYVTNIGHPNDTLGTMGTSFHRWSQIYATNTNSNIVRANDLLGIPTSAPQSGSVVSGEAYLYSSTGSYAETPGGGVADVYPLTITKNGSAWLSYDPGVQAESINLAIPTKVSDLTNDTGFITASSIPSTYAWSAITNTPTTLSGYGITDAKIETPSGTSNRKITLGSNNLTIYSWALASAKPSYTLDEVADGSTRKLANYLPLAGNAVASKITGNVVLGNNVFLQGVHTNGTDVRELIGLDNNNIVTVGCSTNQLRLITSSVDIKHNKNGTLYSVYDESNLTKSVLTTLLDSNSGYYLPLTAGSSKALTGDLYFDATSANKNIYFKDSSNNLNSALLMASNGTLSLGNNQIARGYSTVVQGGTIYVYWNTSAATKGMVFTSSTIRPTSDNGINLGYTNYRWASFHSMSANLYGNLAFNAPSAGNTITWVNSSSVTQEALGMRSNGHLVLGANQITNSKDTYVYGTNIYVTWKSTRQIHFTGDTIIPNSTNVISLGTSTNRWLGVYTKDLYADKLWGLFGTSSESDATFVHRAVPSVAVGDSARVTKVKGKTIVWNQQINPTWLQVTTTTTGVTITNNGDGSWTLTGTNDGTTLNFVAIITSTKFVVGHKYLLRGMQRQTASAKFKLIDTDNGSATDDGSGVVYTATNGTTFQSAFRLRCDSGASAGTGLRLAPQLIDLTLMFGSGNEPTSVAEFEALYPLPYYSYNAGEVVSLTAAKKVKLNNQAASYDSSDWALLSSTYCAKTTNAATQAIILTSKSNSSAAKGVKLNNFSFVVGHKYYIRAELDPTTHIGFYSSNNAVIFNTDVSRKGVVGEVTSSTSYFGLRLSNSAVNNTSYTFRNIMCVDLTLMYGAGFEPTASKFEHDFPQDYIPYNATGVDATIQGGLQTGEFNLLDEENIFSQITGVARTSDGWVATGANIAGYGHYWENTIGYTGQMCIYMKALANSSSGNFRFTFAYTDGTSSSGPVLSGTSIDEYVLSTSGKVVSNIRADYGSNRTITLQKVCFSMADSAKNGTYEPYKTNFLPLPITQITSGGKRIFPDGLQGVGTAVSEIMESEAIKRYDKVDLGSLSWTYTSGIFISADLVGIIAEPNGSGGVTTARCSKYASLSYGTADTSDKCLYVIFASSSSLHGRVYIKDSAYTDAATFKAAMSGVYLHYELKTPVKYILDSPIPLFFKSDKLGTQTLTPENTAVVSTAPLNADFQYGSNLGDAAGANEGYLPLAGGRVTGELNMSAGELVIPDHAPYEPEPNKHYLYVNDNGNYYQS